MFCPRCAAPNLDEAKFCRTCGTNLEPVAVALSDAKHPTTRTSKEAKLTHTPLEKRREARNKIIQASGLIGASAVVGAALGLFSNQPEWIIIWMVFAGWMACWGVIAMVSGISELIEARESIRQLDRGTTESAPARSFLAPTGIETQELTTLELTSPPSVTEFTTEPLIKKHLPTKPPDE